MNSNAASVPYVLVTPARNEATYIEKTIQSVIDQTVLPLRWVIVDDGSTDTTAEIVRKYLPGRPWIELVQLPEHRDRSFAGKVFAFNAGKERIKDLGFEIIGNLDADLSFVPDYFEFLMERFRQDNSLGVAGTIFEEENYNSASDSFEGQNHVAGGCQMFRRRCFEELGGYVPNKGGGIDWIAVTTARMKKWKTRSFRERFFFHHRSLGTAERGMLRSAFSYGEKDYYLGGHPLWEIFRFAYRLTKRPVVLGAIALYAGYLWAFLTRRRRPVSQELMQFHRREQLEKLRSTLSALIGFRQFNKFGDESAAKTSKLGVRRW